ncbi:MAG TPA: hypothetical protein VGZ47_12405 [Gemmataceae bacterium]|jgi:hypothetical protein|nr:hypothetical protein [Gemmataceae bacterium]
MAIDKRIESALGSDEPLNRLRALVRDLQAERLGHQAIQTLFEKAASELRLAGRGRDEDVILEVLDFLVGWCSPHMSLAPEELQ